MHNPRTLPCPNCQEIINETMRVCPHCSAAIDPQVAAAAAELQDKVNQACSDASYVRRAAVLMLVFLGLSFVPFLPLVSWGFLITFFAVIVMVVRWQLRFGKLQTGDPDYRQARRSKNVALALWVAALVLWFVLSVLSVVVGILIRQ